MSVPFGPLPQAPFPDRSYSLIYLASPYSHRDAAVREQRYRDACRATVNLFRRGQNVFSPIVHGHPLVAHGLPTDWSFWEAFDREQIARCDAVFVLPLTGWKESSGVIAEIEIASELEKDVWFVDLSGTPMLAHEASEGRS
ncbi:DUF1937 family protein [Schlesneria sp.]|uniref:DUF1937 family protein n=1 Tax=Schlesneria sp. TaxID=2762018 RepID=UPI002EE78E07